MRITLNGVVLDDQHAIDLRLDIDPAGESIPAIQVWIGGGELKADTNGRGMTVTFDVEDRPRLTLGSGGRRRVWQSDADGNIHGIVEKES